MIRKAEGDIEDNTGEMAPADKQTWWWTENVQ
jgi:hypothetical protein